MISILFTDNMTDIFFEFKEHYCRDLKHCSIFVGVESVLYFIYQR